MPHLASDASYFAEQCREAKSKEENSNGPAQMNASWICHKPQVIPAPSTRAGGRGYSHATHIIIPVVTFLTPLAEHVSDLKDR